MRRILLVAGLAAACGGSRTTTARPAPVAPPASRLPDLSRLPALAAAELGRSPELLIHAVEGRPVVAVAPDGKTIATGENDRAVHIRSLPDFRELRRIESPDAVRLIAGALAFAPDGRLAIGWVPVSPSGGTPEVATYDAATGARLHAFASRTSWVHATQLVWTPDGAHLVIAGNKPAVWRADGQLVGEVDLAFAKQLAVNAAGTHLVARERRPTHHGHWDEHSRSIDQDPGRLYFVSVEPMRVVKTIDFEPAVVAAIGEDFLAASHELLRRYDREGRELASVALGGYPEALVVIGDRVIVASRGESPASHRVRDLGPANRVTGLGEVGGLWPVAPDRLLVLDGKRLRLVQLVR